MATKDKFKSLKLERRTLHDNVINFFNSAEGTYNYKQVSEKVEAVSPKQAALVVEILEQLAIDGFLTETTPGRYKAARRSSVAEGLFVRRSNGKNSVKISDDADSKPIFVAERNSMHALNGDKVLVHISAAREGLEPEAEVLKILERKEQVFIGTLQVKKYFAHLATDSKFLATDIFIPKDKLKGGDTGDKAVVKIIEWPDDANSPVGEVVDILGVAGDNNAEIHAILAEFGLPYKYPEAVERAADELSGEITAEDLAERRDMRDVTTFTIDPADAKDFDDALSIRWLENGHIEVGVHIADVSHFVTPGSIIDKEAYDRATSVYLVDRTVPMLPERLCNFLCSLRQDEDKFAHSVIFELDDNAKLYKTDICHTLIRSNRRFTYEEAQAVIETGHGDFEKEVLKLNDLAQIMRKRRFEEGSVAFNREEVHFEVDENGKPIRVVMHVSKEANKLVEEFMLLANRKVAEAIGKVAKGKKAKSFVYRIHDTPNVEKLANFADIAAHFGYKVKVDGPAKVVNKSINKMLDEVKGKPEEELLSILAIRSMAKAVYSTTNVGHYGLGFEYYTHFTSPIRRYPDLVVHRLLDRYADGGRSVNLEKLESDCDHMSAQEQLAANAERASIKYKEVEFMGDRLGGVFVGHISGVTEWGLYVELDETHCEGMIPVRDLDDDFYEFDEKNYYLIGRRSHRKYRLGDKVKIQVARADLIKKQLDFALVDANNPVDSHHIDKTPITQANRFGGGESKSDRRRSEFEGGHASRRQRRGQSGGGRGRAGKGGRGRGRR